MKLPIYLCIYIYIDAFPIGPWPLGMSFRSRQAQHRGRRSTGVTELRGSRRCSRHRDWDEVHKVASTLRTWLQDVTGKWPNQQVQMDIYI